MEAQASIDAPISSAQPDEWEVFSSTVGERLESLNAVLMPKLSANGVKSFRLEHLLTEDFFSAYRRPKGQTANDPEVLAAMDIGSEVVAAIKRAGLQTEPSMALSTVRLVVYSDDYLRLVVVHELTHPVTKSIRRAALRAMAIVKKRSL